jgi:hypothetical protein
LEEGTGVLAKVEVRCGEQFPHVGFIATNLRARSQAVLQFFPFANHLA